MFEHRGVGRASRAVAFTSFAAVAADDIGELALGETVVVGASGEEANLDLLARLQAVVERTIEADPYRW